ncbi:hypothetical protein GGU10DRAFT_371049 [Lentinula aff. detonsa]|uniref:BOD1/SHG1 domain-containing protein n=1 Tax=Lentinula aff. detonsa TaxID=2804958 RepID=A0AA38NT52_9AGAR|nr:hypothetical protein GGU10DRAFT_371049 [Lentinula aff. detonsa]
MPATNPNQLVEEFKKSGEFDRLRRELFAEFQKGDHMHSFNKKTEDVVQQRFASMKTRSFISARFNKDESNLRTELLQEIQRPIFLDSYPYVETSVNDMPTFSDQNFNDNLKSSIMRILKEEPNENEKHWDSKENDADEKHLNNPRDSGHSDYKREEDDTMDESADKKDEEKETKTEEPGSVLVNGKHELTTTASLSTQVSVNDNDTKEPDVTKDASISPPSLTRRSSSNLSSLSSVSSLSPSVPAESSTDKPSTTHVPDNLSLPRPAADVHEGSNHTVQNGDTVKPVEPTLQQTSEDNSDVVMGGTEAS